MLAPTAQSVAEARISLPHGPGNEASGEVGGTFEGGRGRAADHEATPEISAATEGLSPEMEESDGEISDFAPTAKSGRSSSVKKEDESEGASSATSWMELGEKRKASTKKR